MERRLLLSGTNSVPQFNHGTLGWPVPVDSLSGTVLGQLTASDPDGDSLTFSSDGGDSGAGSSSGVGSGAGGDSLGGPGGDGASGPGTLGNDSGGSGTGGGSGSTGGDGSGGTGSDDELPDELKTSEIEGTGDGHGISANSQFIGYQSANTGMNVGIGLTVTGGQPSAPSLSFGTSLSTNSGGMDSASIGVDLQTPTPDGFQYVSFGSGGSSGGASNFGFGHSFADGEEGEGPDIDLSLDVGSSGFEQGGGNVKVISSKDYTEPNGDEVTELQVVFSSGSESALAEHGLDEGEITDFAEVGSDGLTHFLSVYTYRGYSDTDDGPVLTHTNDNQSVLTATYDFSGSIDEGGSPVKVLLGLTGDPAGEGENEIDYKSTSHSVVDNLPHLPGVRVENTYTVTIDATVTVTIDGSGTSGTVSGTKTSEGVSIVEGIFHSGTTTSMDVDGNITDQRNLHPAGTTYYGEGTVSLDDTFGITVPSKEELLARLREAVATKVRIEAIMAHDPDVGANLASQLTDIETSIADLEGAAADAGATTGEIAAAKSAGAADAASFDPAGYVANVHLIRGDSDSTLLQGYLEFDEWLLGDIHNGWAATATNFSAGWGDTLSFGATSGIRWLGGFDAVNYDSNAYFAGQVTGTVHGFAIMGANAGPTIARQGSVAKYFNDPRKWDSVRKAWSTVRGTVPASLKIRNLSLHHVIAPQRWSWVPQGLMNAGFNYMPMNAWRNSVLLNRTIFGIRHYEIAYRVGYLTQLNPIVNTSTWLIGQAWDWTTGDDGE